jgi:ADP-heptose:LPS heptosyltransferase
LSTNVIIELEKDLLEKEKIRTRFVTAVFRSKFMRAPTAVELSHWVAIFQADTDVQRFLKQVTLAVADANLLSGIESSSVIGSRGFIRTMEPLSHVTGNFTLSVEVKNLSKHLWTSEGPNSINISYHWLDEDGNMVVFDGKRTPLPEGGIATGESKIVSAQIYAPEKSGNYRLMLTLVQEKIGWYEDRDDFSVEIISILFSFSNILRICVVKLDHIGDLVLATPVFRALKEKFPSCNLTAVVAPEASSILQGNPFVNNIVEYSAPWFWREQPSGNDLRARLSANTHSLSELLSFEYDFIVNLRADLANLIFASSLKHRDLLGFTNHTIYPFLVSDPVQLPGNLHAWAQHRFLLAQGFGISSFCEPEIFPSEKDFAKAGALIADNQITIAIAPGAGIALKKWPAENFHSLIKLLAARKMRIIIVGSRDDYELGEKIRQTTPAHNVCGRLNLLELSALLSKCDALVSNDSAPAHIGAASGTTVVCIIRPNVVEEFRPVGEHHIVLGASTCTSPCGGFDINSRDGLQQICRCITEITVDEVFASVLQAVERSNSRLPDVLGGKAELGVVSHSQSDSNRKILIIRGDLRSHSGYAYATRCYTASWARDFDTVYGVDISYHPSRYVDVWPYPLIDDNDVLSECKQSLEATVITISSPDNFVRFDGAKNVGLFFYETDRFEREEWWDNIMQMDEIRVPAPFLTRLVESLEHPPTVIVEPVPLPTVNAPALTTRPQVNFFRLTNRGETSDIAQISDFSSLKSQYSHIFFSTFTVIPRKGLPVLAHEWLSFVHATPNCALLLKVSSIDITHSKEHIISMLTEQFQKSSRFFPPCSWNVYVTADSLSDQDILGLQTESDGFITCSFGEGFGLGLFESLLIGTPVVCPRHTTFNDFLPEDYPYFLDTEYANFGLADPACVYPISAHWGVPKEGSLAPVLKNLISDISTGKIKTSLDSARANFESHFNNTVS